MSFGKLEHELINLLRTGAPDFEAAEMLLAQGANINAQSGNNENVLSDILLGYWQIVHVHTNQCDNCDEDSCIYCIHRAFPALGKNMCKTIQFFLNNGFDVNKNGGRFGAQCLTAISLSTYDQYIIDAVKLLFDAGAKNIAVADAYDTPWSYFGMESSFQNTCEKDYALGNIFEAVCQIFEAVENCRPYSGIDFYKAAIGKKILKVLAEPTEDEPVFYSIDLPSFKKDMCFISRLYFVYDDGILIVTESLQLWVDTILPDSNLIDISEYFPDIAGASIERFSFDYREIYTDNGYYGQPIITFEMDSDTDLQFSINFGEVKNEDRAAYFEIVPL